MDAFSRQESKRDAILIKQYRAKIKARQGHPEMKLKHPDWCRDAVKGDYTVMNRKIKEDCIKAQERTEKFRSKLHARQN